MLARALALEPRCCCSTSRPRPSTRPRAHAVEATLLDLRERLDISTVLVTHDLDQARRMADWVVRLDEGRAWPGPGQRELLPASTRVIAMTSTSIHVTLGEVAATLALVAVAVAVSFWRKADLERGHRRSPSSARSSS